MRELSFPANLPPRSADGTPAPSQATWFLPSFLACCLLGIVLRGGGAGQASMWTDEGVSLYVASLPLGDWADTATSCPPKGTLLWTVSHLDGHPPLYYLLLHSWLGALQALSGFLGRPPATESPLPEWLLRVPSVLAAVASLVYTGRLAAWLLPQRAARTAMLLAATSQAAIYATHEVRMYPLLGWLTLAAAWHGARAWLQGDRREWMLWWTSSVLACYTHYLGLLAPPAFALWCYHERARSAPRSAWRLAAALTTGGLAFAPWCSVLHMQLLNGQGPPAVAGVGRQMMLPALAQTAVDTVWGPSLLLRAGSGWWTLLALLTTLLLAWGLRQLWRCSPSLATLTLAWSGAPIGTLALLSLWGSRNLLQARYFMYLTPWAALTLGAALSHRKRWTQGVLGVIVAVNAIHLGRWHLDATCHRQPVRPLVQQLSASLLPGDLVLVEQPLALHVVRYYLKRQVVDKDLLARLERQVRSISPRDLGRPGLADEVERSQRVWLVMLSPWVDDPEQQVPRWLDEHKVMTSMTRAPSYESAYDGILLCYTTQQTAP